MRRPRSASTVTVRIGGVESLQYGPYVSPDIAYAHYLNVVPDEALMEEDFDEFPADDLQAGGSLQEREVENGAGGSGVIPYLPLPELRPGATTTTTGN